MFVRLEMVITVTKYGPNEFVICITLVPASTGLQRSAASASDNPDDSDIINHQIENV